VVQIRISPNQGSRNWLWLSRMHVPDEVKQGYEEEGQETDDTEPHEYERTLVGIWRRRADAKDERQATKNVGQEVDHGRIARGRESRWIQKECNTARRLLRPCAVYYDAEFHRIES
jgi:hypothetical protein